MQRNRSLTFNAGGFSDEDERPTVSPVELMTTSKTRKNDHYHKLVFMAAMKLREIKKKKGYKEGSSAIIRAAFAAALREQNITALPMNADHVAIGRAGFKQWIVFTSERSIGEQEYAVITCFTF